ncbi:hypothetical protein FCOIX_1436 [Fusarium coicis]|nr:hypothetical protein FCOIX_1436 [Fusarium coicis]
MLSQYRVSKTTIRRQYVVNLLAGDRHEDLLQDTLGLLYLELSDKQPDNHVMKYIIRQWNSKSLPDPFEEKDQTAIAKLYKFLCSMSMFVEDYISKATSSNPPQTYLCLPQIGDPNRGLYYKEHSFSPRHVTLDDLTSSERHRLVWAFIKYDMYYKIQSPKVALLTGDNEHSAICEKAFEELTNGEREALSFLGFDLLGDLVRFANKAQPEDIRSWFYTITSHAERSQYLSLDHYRFPFFESFWEPPFNRPDGSPSALLVQRLFVGGIWNLNQGSVLYTLRIIFKQRAWIFLDDTRLLQKGLGHFPAIEDLEHRPLPELGLETMHAAEERQRRRHLQLCQYRREAGTKDTQNEGQEYIFKGLVRISSLAFWSISQ